MQVMDPIQALAECCSPVPGRVPLTRDQAEGYAEALRALADPARLQLLSLISAQGGEACVCDLPGPLGLSQPTVSHHLKVLHEAGLLTRERRGRWVHYAIVRERFKPLRGALAG